MPGWDSQDPAARDAGRSRPANPSDGGDAGRCSPATVRCGCGVSAWWRQGPGYAGGGWTGAGARRGRARIGARCAPWAGRGALRSGGGARRSGRRSHRAFYGGRQPRAAAHAFATTAALSQGRSTSGAGHSCTRRPARRRRSGTTSRRRFWTCAMACLGERLASVRALGDACSPAPAGSAGAQQCRRRRQRGCRCWRAAPTSPMRRAVVKPTRRPEKIAARGAPEGGRAGELCWRGGRPVRARGSRKTVDKCPIAAAAPIGDDCCSPPRLAVGQPRPALMLSKVHRASGTGVVRGEMSHHDQVVIEAAVFPPAASPPP